MFDDVRNHLPYEYLKRAVPQYDAAGRHAVSVNQASGQSLYPFAEPEGINAGYVANIDFVSYKPVKRPIFVSSITRDCGLQNSDDYDWKTMSAQDWLSIDTFPKADYMAAPTQLKLSDGTQVIFNTLSARLISITERSGIKSYLWLTEDAQLYYAEYITANDFTKPLLFPQSYEGLIELIPRCYHVKSQPISASGYGDTVALTLKPNTFTSLETSGNVITVNALMPTRVNNQYFLQSINNVSSDTAGSLVVSTDQCIRFEPHSLQPHTLLFNDDCTACCTCDNYMLLASQQQQLAEHLKLKINQLNKLKHKVVTAYEEYNDRIAVKRSKLSEIFIECGQLEATLWFNIYNPETTDFNRPLDVSVKLTTNDPSGVLYLTGQNTPEDTTFENNVISFTLPNGIDAGSAVSASFLLKIYTTLDNVTIQAGLLITNDDKKYAPFAVAEGVFTRKREIVSSGNNEVLIPDSAEPEPIIHYQCPDSVTVSDMQVHLGTDELSVSYGYTISMEDGLKPVSLRLRRYIYGLNIVKDDARSSVCDFPDGVVIEDGSYGNAQLSEYIFTSPTAVNEDGEPYYTGLDMSGTMSEIIPIHRLTDVLIPATVKIEIHFDMLIMTPDNRTLHCVHSDIMTAVLQT
jgi:hypothetical protein